MENAETRTVKFEQMNPAPYNPRVDLKPEDPEYCDVIIKRWEQLTGKKAELIKE